ncbi:MAG: ComF family protein [Leptospirales bacterium]|nr:ComF family protein [Leptospirales bacterium]
MNILNALLDIVSPGWCASCGRPVAREERHLCKECFSKIEYVKDACPVCSGIIDPNTGECGICSKRHIYFDKNISIAEYDGVIKSLIADYKFGSKKRCASLLADICFERAEDLLEKTDCVTAVPSSRRKKLKRGFNQSELIAKELARMAGRPYKDILKEKQSGHKQKTLGFSDRFFNVLDRYELKSRASSPCAVLIVDDVFTTGATLNECSRTLKDAGFAPVFSLAAARVGIKNT